MLVEDELALAVDDALVVELRGAGDGFRAGCLRRVEVDDFLAGLFEGQDHRVGWEDGEFGVEFLFGSWLVSGRIGRVAVGASFLT